MTSRKKINFYASNDSRDDFVGARIYETRIDFFFPLGFKFDAENFTECLKSAFKILSIVATVAPSRNLHKFSDASSSAMNEPFNSYIWILNDYLKNGLYNLREKVFVNSYRGKINWKRTLQTTPFVHEDNFVFLNPVAEQYSSTSDMITTIHKYCLNLSLEKVGWLFGAASDDKSFKQVSEQMKTYYINVLMRELRQTFEDRKKILLTHLLRVLESSVGESFYNNRFELGTYKFSFVWENMIRQVYGNLPLEKFFPNAYWCIGDNPPVPSSHLRPDTVMTVGQKLYVLDAKYYKYGLFENNPSLLPNSDSIQKQITYGDHAALKFGGDFPNGIKNAFIVPFSSKDDVKVRYVGYAVPGWRDDEKNSHRKVHLVLLDTNYLVELYRKGNKSDVLKYELAKVIDDGLTYDE